ncbi:MAG: hypothetical protein NTX05_05235 [Fusobacteria bacterium]|nr:hypothetical protein [Fusobacteriota bacterium]
MRNKKNAWKNPFVIIIIIILLLVESGVRTNFAFLPLMLALIGWISYKMQLKALPLVLLLGIYESVGTGSVYYIFSYIALSLVIIYISSRFELEDFGVVGLSLIESMYYLITYTLFVHSRITVIDVIVEVILVIIINKIFVLLSRNDA